MSVAIMNKERKLTLEFMNMPGCKIRKHIQPMGLALILCKAKLQSCRGGHSLSHRIYLRERENLFVVSKELYTDGAPCVCVCVP